MNYVKIYEQLINKAIYLDKIGYLENHHIIPKSLGGPNHHLNLIKLTPRLHYIAHLLLYKIYKDELSEHRDKTAYYKMLFALTSMINLWGSIKYKFNIRNIKFNSRLYNKVKSLAYKRIRESLKIKLKDKEFRRNYCKSISNGVKRHNKLYGSPWIGKKHSELTKLKIGKANSISLKGDNNWMKNRIWIKNPITKLSMNINKNTPIPDGWVKGRIIKNRVRI